jgi:transposase-like protein
MIEPENERTRAMIESFRRCKSTGRVAKEFGVSASAIRQTLDRYGVERRHAIGRPKTLPPAIVCEHCKKPFPSRYAGKKFCTLRCYVASDVWKHRVRARAEDQKRQARIKAGLAPDEVPTITCLNCGAEREVKVNFVKDQKYCNQKCYREYMAGRFDRYVANPESLALPQNYDEILTKEELPCLIEGCGWSGVQLSQHMNFTHGIKKGDFKRMAGFNATTGVVTADYSQKLSESKKGQGWGAEHMARLRSLVKNNPGPPNGADRRLEGREHAVKSLALMRESREYRDVTCKGCGVTFSTNAMIKLFCSVRCRDETHRQELRNRYALRVHDLTCETCKKLFRGNDAQKQRADAGKVVVCSYSCRQKRAGHIAQGTWAGR